jgi:hypothetical protein
MSAVLDNSLVGLALLASILYAFATLSPRNTRRRVFGRLAELLARAPKALRLRPAAERLARAAGAKAQGACGGCDSCGSEPQAQTSGAEISVPIARIARARASRQE